MRLIILSDIHGNLEALNAVLKDAEKFAVGRAQVVCLGDMVGYGANPEEVVQALRGLGVQAVLGNHEEGVIDPNSRGSFNPQAWQTVRWAAAQLSDRNKKWIAGLPASLSLEGCRFTHGLPPGDVHTYLFQASAQEVLKAMAQIPEEVCFVGHTHQLRLLSIIGNELKQERLEEGVRVLAPGVRYIVNAGAVGQPRDGDPRAKFCVYDPASRELTVRFVSYDAKAAAGKILAAGQPRVFAERLAQVDE